MFRLPNMSATICLLLLINFCQASVFSKEAGTLSRLKQRAAQVSHSGGNGDGDGTGWGKRSISDDNGEPATTSQPDFNEQSDSSWGLSWLGWGKRSANAATEVTDFDISGQGYETQEPDIMKIMKFLQLNRNAQLDDQYETVFKAEICYDMSDLLHKHLKTVRELLEKMREMEC